MVNNINFLGNKKIKEDVIKEELQLKSRNVFQKKELQDDLNVIRDLYKRSGYFSAKITTKISKLSQNRIDVTFKIAEGEKTKIKGICEYFWSSNSSRIGLSTGKNGTMKRVFSWQKKS